MPNTELLDGIAGLLQRPNLEPEARRLIEMSLEAQKTGKLPSVAELREKLVVQTGWSEPLLKATA